MSEPESPKQEGLTARLGIPHWFVAKREGCQGILLGSLQPPPPPTPPCPEKRLIGIYT